MENWNIGDKALCVIGFNEPTIPSDVIVPIVYKEYNVDGIESNKFGTLSLTFVEIPKVYSSIIFGTHEIVFPANHFIKLLSDSELERLVEENKESITV